MRLGNLDALKEAINKIIDEEIEIDEKWAMGLKYSLKIIDNAQTVEPQYISDLSDDAIKDLKTFAIDYTDGIAIFERRQKGKWVFKDLHNGKTWYECSICGRKIHVGDKAQLSDFPYCHCGADMRGDKA